MRSAILHVHVALRIEREILEHETDGVRLLRVVPVDDRLQRSPGLTAERTLKVAEVDNQHLRAFIRHNQRHAGLRVIPALEFRLLILHRGLRDGRRHGAFGGGAVPGREHHGGRRAGDKKHDDRDRGGIDDRGSQILQETSR